MTIFNIIITFIWLIFLVYWLVSALSSKKNARGSRTWIVRMIMVLVIFALFQFHAFDWIQYYQWTISQTVLNGIISLILTMAGVGLAIWARVHLGKNWGMPMSTKQDPELVTSGPYKYIRHPIYAGVFLAMIGSIFIGGLEWLLLFIVFFAYAMFSATREEKNMMKQFPEQYGPYMKRTKMIIPYVL